ncbi:MAG: ABC transporter ATP-binding protein [Gemmatimonadetes bacterium]|nr:ABC transporter ATP-binding protein [Gemmatimonadota bacterium]
MTFETRNLTVRYPRSAGPALSSVTLSTPAHSLCAVLGPNGSGKSTLMRALLGVAPISGGEALVDGVPVDRWARRDLARLVGAVPQNESVAFPLSVRELVAMGRYPHLGPLRAEGDVDRQAIDRALERCEISELARRSVTTLSGGELQLARIARALAQEPRGLALDEPTASLDVHHEMAIFELLRDFAATGITILLVTHSLNLAARFADHLLLLHRGKVVAQGKPQEVLDADILERVYRWRVAVREDPLAGGAPQVTPLSLRTSRAPTASA